MNLGNSILSLHAHIWAHGLIWAVTWRPYMVSHWKFQIVAKRSLARVPRRPLLAVLGGWGLSPNGYRLQFKMPAAQERSCADEFARWQILSGEVTAVGGVELVVEGKIGAGDLHVDQIIHAHTRLSERGFDAVEQKFEFLVNFRWSFAGLGIDADPPGEIERIPGEDGAAKRQLGIIVGKIDGTPRRWRRLRKRSIHANHPRKNKHNK
jgi:hypothetical protein